MRFLAAAFLCSSLCGRALPPASAPGRVDSLVTQENLAKTSCGRGWARAVRPPGRYTNRLKIASMAELGLPGKPRAYEEDHRVPIEVGGDPRDPKNLWPQPWPEARLKDRLENAVRKDVCAGKLTLRQGQSIFLGDFWVEYDRRFE